MINGKLRPWGKPGWLLGMPTLQNKEWMLIGSVATQDRCLGMLRHRGTSYRLGHAAFLEIIDEDSQFTARTTRRRGANRLLWETEAPVASRELHSFALFDPIKKLKNLVDTWTNHRYAENIILDTSTLPERFLFPMIRWLLESPNVRNLVFTYMLPERYTHEDLAYNAREAAHLPTFLNDSTTAEGHIKHVIVGVGFMSFSLPEWLKKTYLNPKVKVSLLFPFPSKPANVKKGWEFVRRVEHNVNLADDRQIARVDAHDLSACYDRIRSITSNGKSPAVFAPFGPKAHSVAMCLQAINMGAEVFYTHPSYYHPDYSTGLRLEDGLPYGYAYAARLNGNDLYSG